MLFKKIVIAILMNICFSLHVSAGAFMLDESDFEQAIKQEFVDQGQADDTNIELELFSGQVFYPSNGEKEAKVIINNLKVDENAGRFSCEAEIFADRQSVAKSQLQGKYFLMSQVWVPAQNIAKGEMISSEKLKSKNIRKTKLKPFMVTEKEKLIGQVAQHSLKEGRIVSEKDVGAKILVKRNDVVLAVYRTPQMQITTKAIAQQDGAYGQRIELQNAKTRKMLTGIVQDEATVVIEQ